MTVLEMQLNGTITRAVMVLLGQMTRQFASEFNSKDNLFTVECAERTGTGSREQ